MALQDEEYTVTMDLADIAARTAGHLSMPGLIERHLPGAARKRRHLSRAAPRACPILSAFVADHQTLDRKDEGRVVAR